MTRPRLAVYSLTRDRLRDTRMAFAGLAEMAGEPYDHYVMDNGSQDGTPDYLKLMKAEGLLQYLYLSPDNKGQCIASNLLLQEILKQPYEFVLRYDNDIIPQTPYFVRSLIEASKSLGPTAVVSPAIEGLLHLPQAFGEKRIGPYTFGFVEILGGACRLMPQQTLEGFRFGEHGQLSLGEASKFAAHCQDNKFPMAYVSGITVKHDTAAHVRENPEYFKRRAIEDFVPYGL